MNYSKTNATLTSIVLLIISLMVMGCSDDNDIIEDVDNTDKSVVRYAAENAKGKKNGATEADAADLLDMDFWLQVQYELKTSPVEVKLLPGDYHKAYIDMGLTLKGIGNETNRLTITGGDDVLFHVLEGYATRSNLIYFNSCQNIHVRDLHFTGHGSINYVMAVRSTTGAIPSHNILIENCSWTDMNGIVYGATGCHYDRTTDITYQSCTFKRIGKNSGSHMMYHAYDSSNISVIDCHFEDCTGEYVRFRDKCDFGMVRNSVFIRNDHEKYVAVAFIAVPCYNDVDPGDEYFATNYAFTENQFTNLGTNTINSAITFNHRGFTPKEFQYLLSTEEAAVLQNGTREERMALLKEQLGVETGKIRVNSNALNGAFTRYVGFYSKADYGAVSRGWTGSFDITDLVNQSSEKYEWEKEAFTGWE